VIFKDINGQTLGSFKGGETYTGTDLATRNADDDDIKHSAITHAVQQVTSFLLSNGVPPAL
jgi:hypothetical protein